MRRATPVFAGVATSAGRSTSAPSLGGDRLAPAGPGSLSEGANPPGQQVLEGQAPGFVFLLLAGGPRSSHRAQRGERARSQTPLPPSRFEGTRPLRAAPVQGALGLSVSQSPQSSSRSFRKPGPSWATSASTQPSQAWSAHFEVRSRSRAGVGPPTRPSCPRDRCCCAATQTGIACLVGALGPGFTGSTSTIRGRGPDCVPTARREPGRERRRTL